MTTSPPVSGTYQAVLRIPGVARMLAVGSLTRLPIAMELIALSLFARTAGTSFAIAGSIVAAFALANGISTPLLARLIDRRGPRAVLFPAAATHAAALGLLVAAGLLGLPGFTLICLAVVAGAAAPPTSSVVRRLLGAATEGAPQLAPVAFALDSIGTEAMFVFGPLLTTVFVAVLDPAAALIFAAALDAVSVALLAATPIARGWEVGDRGWDAHWLGALRSPGVRTVVALCVPIGMIFGAFQVGLVAFAEAKGSQATAAWLVALLSIGGVGGALAYGGVAGRFQPRTSALALACALPLLLVWSSVASSLGAMAGAIVLAGLALTPLMSVTSHIISEVALSDTEAEAFAWPFTSLAIGLALGAFVAGQAIEMTGWRGGMLTALACAVGVALIALTTRRTLPVAAPRPLRYPEGES